MCHLVLLLPILGLAVFWIWPLPVAIPVYAVVAALSGLLYAFVLKAMRKPVRTGKEHLVGAVGTVVARTDAGIEVRVESELWTADAMDAGLDVGDVVRVVGLEGLKLVVSREPAPDEPVGHGAIH